jgi:hypothetical protein
MRSEYHNSEQPNQKQEKTQTEYKRRDIRVTKA